MSTGPIESPRDVPPPASDVTRRAGELFVEHQELVHYIAMMNAPNISLVDDIVQNVCVKFIQKAATHDLETDVRPLLQKMTRDMAADAWTDYIRSQPASLARVYERIASRTRQRDSIAGLATAEDEINALRICIKKLSKRSRAIVQRHYEEGIPLTEIAKELEMNINTLYYHIDRIRSVVKSCVENTINSGVADV